jgi:hypothetical protein
MKVHKNEEKLKLKNIAVAEIREYSGKNLFY